MPVGMRLNGFFSGSVPRKLIPFRLRMSDEQSSTKSPEILYNVIETDKAPATTVESVGEEVTFRAMENLLLQTLRVPGRL